MSRPSLERRPETATRYPKDRVRCVVQSSDVLGETPLWCERTQSLLWLDIDAGRVQRFQPSTGRHDIFAFDARYVGTLALTERTTQVLLGMELGLYLFDLGSGDRRLLCQVEPAEIDNRLNDGRCDARGRLWVGTIDNQLHRPNGAFYRVDPDGTVHRQFGDVIVSNTVAFSPAHDRLYFSDTRRFTTWHFDLDVFEGRLGNRCVFLDHTATQDRPDGACVDQEGYLWNATFAAGRVVRYAPDGTVDTIVDLPVTNPTCVCLGGPEMRTLYVTTARKFLDRAQLRSEPLAGAVLAIDVATPGLPESRFKCN
jgi:sugar lactone lactonase YvrE